ncbi:Ff.00g022730.m01.CDS01 [Fusarium sp. VM40]|nr:Ff.00g022730.m01.CDS01 [Fusarium sp. VM40]
MDGQTVHPTSRFDCVALFESPSGNLFTSHQPFSSNDSPEKLVIDILKTHKEHVGRWKRVFYRGILLKKPVVSIAKISRATLQTSSRGQEQFWIQSKVYDATLTSAIRNPAVLRNVDLATFCHEYKDVVVDAGGSTPQAAILIHLVNDPTASKVVGAMGSVISITLGLVGAFVL